MPQPHARMNPNGTVLLTCGNGLTLHLTGIEAEAVAALFSPGALAMRDTQRHLDAHAALPAPGPHWPPAPGISAASPRKG